MVTFKQKEIIELSEDGINDFVVLKCPEYDTFIFRVY